LFFLGYCERILLERTGLFLLCSARRSALAVKLTCTGKPLSLSLWIWLCSARRSALAVKLTCTGELLRCVSPVRRHVSLMVGFSHSLERLSRAALPVIDAIENRGVSRDDSLNEAARAIISWGKASFSQLEAIAAARQLEKTMVTNGVEQPRLVLTPTLPIEISTSEGSCTIEPAPEREIRYWTMIDFVRFCADTRIGLKHAGDHVNAAHWVRLQDSVFNFMETNKFDWARGGKIYLLHILNGLRKHEFTMDDFASDYSVVALTLQLRVSNLYNHQPSPQNSKKGAKPDPFLPQEHIKKFLVWKEEVDHATKCPGCGKKYLPKDCLSHYKHCTDLEAVRAEHQE